ncbi:MAG: type II toxin-antitoxin system VapC family toxin [Deltaproteobacteria bacterium]|nr:type II toxin-antitoxin system VapC family toxin [Deltaproteobacteria bacterium]
MITFIDSSVLLRKLFGEANSLKEWSQISQAFASRILILEIGRVIDRTRLNGQIDDQQVESLHQEARRVLHSIDVIALTDNILTRAAGPMPTVLGSLDAIHLATAIELQSNLENELVLATHDTQLARAARASGFEVIGV